MAVDFACDGCGSAAVAMPEEFAEDALVRCRRCGEALCTWGEFKDRARQVLVEENTHQGRLKIVSCDPLRM